MVQPESGFAPHRFAMTFAVCIKINDGIVLAADSAATILGRNASGEIVANIYENAEKVFNLRKGRPIGMVAWGLGAIGSESIPTLARDLRARLSEGGVDELRAGYSLRDVAERAKAFFYDEKYQPMFGELPPEEQPSFGFVVAGFSGDGGEPEEYVFRTVNGVVHGPEVRNDGNAGTVSVAGEVEPALRLLNGVSPLMPQVLQGPLGVNAEEAEKANAIMCNSLAVQLAHPAMPIQDAIDLAEFLVEVTIRWSRFSPGAPTVGGPIEIAAITKHEDFRWVRRKHYFDGRLNPSERSSGRGSDQEDPS